MSDLIRPHPFVAQTERILLRRLRLADLEAFQAYRSDPEIGRYQGWTPMSEAEAAAFLSEMESTQLFTPGRWCQIAIAGPPGQELYGDIGICLSEDQGEAEIGFTLAASRQGQGVAAEAVREAIRLIFEMTPARLVKGITDARNARSINTLVRVGMERVDTHQALFQGEPCTEHVYVRQRPGSQVTPPLPAS